MDLGRRWINLDLSSHSPSRYWMHMLCVIAASGKVNSLIVLSSILSSWISGSSDRSKDMLITRGDSSGTLSVVGWDNNGAPSVEHLSSSLLRELRKFWIELTWIGSSHALRSPPESVSLFFFFLFLFWRKISRKK